MGGIKNFFKSIFLKPFLYWNIENRAHKVLDKQDKGIAKMAPKHPTTVKQIEKFNRENMDLMTAQKQKNESLHKMLEGMVVHPDKAAEIISKSRVPLSTPEIRGYKENVVVDEYGYTEPETIPPGKCTIKQVVQFTSDYQSDPQTHTVQQVAKQYNLDPDQLRNVLKYFQTFQVFIPGADGPVNPSGHIPSGEQAQLLEKGPDHTEKRKS